MTLALTFTHFTHIRIISNTHPHFLGRESIKKQNTKNPRKNHKMSEEEIFEEIVSIEND
jgi:hypothetical protein